MASVRSLFADGTKLSLFLGEESGISWKESDAPGAMKTFRKCGEGERNFLLLATPTEHNLFLVERGGGHFRYQDSPTGCARSSSPQNKKFQ